MRTQYRRYLVQFELHGLVPWYECRTKAEAFMVAFKAACDHKVPVTIVDRMARKGACYQWRAVPYDTLIRPEARK